MNASFYVSSSSFKTFLLSSLFRYVMLVATVVMELELLNKNKLNGVHVYIYIYIVKHNYILCSMFTNTKAQLHVLAINVGRPSGCT